MEAEILPNCPLEDLDPAVSSIQAFMEWCAVTSEGTITPDPSLELMISLAHTLNSPLRPAFPFIPGNPGSPGGPALPGVPMKPGSPLMPGKVQRKASQSLA